MAIVYGFCRITTTQQQQKDSYPAKVVWATIAPGAIFSLFPSQRHL
jgi:hypothetical protein